MDKGAEGYTPWYGQESDMTEWLIFSLSLSLKIYQLQINGTWMHETVEFLREFLQRERTIRDLTREHARIGTHDQHKAIIINSIPIVNIS